MCQVVVIVAPAVVVVVADVVAVVGVAAGVDLRFWLICGLQQRDRTGVIFFFFLFNGVHWNAQQ